MINVLANDTAANGTTLTLAAVSAPRNGTAEIVGNQIRYTPSANFFGRDSFFYTVNNGDLTTTRQTTVDVTITAVNDAPNAILLRAALTGTAAPAPVAENAPVGTVVGLLMARDPDLACNVLPATSDCRTGVADRAFLFTLTENNTNSDNQFFTIEQNSAGVVNLYLVQSLVGRGKTTYTVGVTVRDPEKATFSQTVTVQVTDTNDPPTAIRLSNSAINEQQPVGTTVGSLTSDDPDSPGNNAHTYELIDGSGSDDNALFAVAGQELRTAAILAFADKTVRTIRLRSTDGAGNTFEQILLVTINSLPSSVVAAVDTTIRSSATALITNSLGLCQGTPIELFKSAATVAAAKRVLVQIDQIVVSAVTDSSCTVTGKMSITTNGSTRSNLAFRGDVNTRNQFITSSIADFELNVAGIELVAHKAEVEYVSERATLHITRPEFRMPRELGGETAFIPVPTIIDTDGVQFSSGRFPLPSIRTISGFALELSGSLAARADGFEIQADGELSIPTIKKGGGQRVCSIGAGVTIFADAQGQTVLAIAAGDANPANGQNAGQIAFTGDDLNGPAALDALRLGAIRASASCSPGLAIGTTGLFLTSVSGEVTVVPGNERLDIEVVIVAGKSLPVIGPLVTATGTMGFQPSPFQFDIGGTINVLVFEMARADASIGERGFKARIQSNQVFFIIPYTTDVSIAAFTKDGGEFTFVGSGRVGIEMRRGSFGRKCTPRILFVPAFCVLLPPFDLPTLAAARVDAGEFTNGLFGFKGSVSVLSFGSAGFFVGHDGKFEFRNIDSFRLITAPFVAALRAEWERAVAAGDVVNAAAAWNEFTFLQDGAGNNTGMIVDVPLAKPMVDLTGVQAAGATDVISQVNLIQTGDVLFNLIATEPLGLSLFTPGGQEVTPANYTSIPGYEIEYVQSIVWGEASAEVATNEGDFIEPETGADPLPSSRLLFTAVSSDPTLTGLDLLVDGLTVYYAIDPQDTVWLTPLVLAPGEHALELRKHGTTNVVLQTTLTLITDTTYSLVSHGGATKGLALLTDNNEAPATMGKAKVRFANMATPTLKMVVNGTPLFSNIGYLAVSDYALLDAGANTIEFRDNGSNALVSTALTVDLADGGVYTFFATDDVTDALPGFDVQILQRQDARYSPVYYTTFSIDQAPMNESWKVKVTGDTDNVPYALSVEGPDSPPILGTVTVDASNLAATQVSWQLTSDFNPTTVQIYANPGAISDSFTFTDTNNLPNTAEIPLYEGQLLAEFAITNLAELGGQLVTKVVDLSGLPSGTYHLWVRANDGLNGPASSYASAPAVLAANATPSRYGLNAVWLAKDDYSLATEFADATPIVIDGAATFPAQWTATITPTLDIAANALDVEWQINSHPDVDSYRLLVGNSPLSPTLVITAGTVALLDVNDNLTGVEVGFARIENVRPAVTYFLALEAVDTESGRTVRSQEVPFSVAAGAFSLTSQQATVAVAAGGSATVPVTLNAGGALFFSNVWLTADLGNTPLGVTARFRRYACGLPGSQQWYTDPQSADQRRRQRGRRHLSACHYWVQRRSSGSADDPGGCGCRGQDLLAVSQPVRR